MKIVNRHGNELTIKASEWPKWRLRGAKQVESAAKAKRKSAENGSESVAEEEKSNP